MQKFSLALRVEEPQDMLGICILSYKHKHKATKAFTKDGRNTERKPIWLIMFWSFKAILIKKKKVKVDCSSSDAETKSNSGWE